MTTLGKIFYAILALIGASAMLMGAAMMVAAHRDGAIRYAAPKGGSTVEVTVTRAGEPDLYWRYFAMFGGLPFLLGAGAVAWGVRGVRR
jgi:hypothetical protein